MLKSVKYMLIAIIHDKFVCEIIAHMEKFAL